ncbi:MAG: winged helix-turn-helix transcriptional regulator [Chitinophagaceae bacterium]|nr:winged helix-turn-helix transcriptional regulator [Rubrivivax sp.]
MATRSPPPPVPPVPSGAPTPVGCTNLKLKQASRLVARHYDVFVAPTGLRGTQYSLLSHVVKLGPLRAGELAASMRLDASTLSRNLQPLIDHGWVQVTAGSDGRSRVVQASASGLALRSDAQQAWKRAQVALNDTLGTARVAALHALLDECMGRLEAAESSR